MCSKACYISLFTAHKTYKKKADEWTWMCGPEFPAISQTHTHTQKKVYYAGNKMEARSYALVACDSPHSEVDI